MPSDIQINQGFAAAIIQCPKCTSERVRRIERNGILEKHILKLFGYFPWRCASCREKFFLQRRSRDNSKPREYVG